MVNAIRVEVTRTVQQQVTEVVRREVKSIVYHEFQNSLDENVAAINQQQVTSTFSTQVTTIVQEQVTLIPEKQLSSGQLSSPHPSYANVQTTPSTLTDILYCTVDVSNVEEADRAAANVSNIRKEIEKGMREGEERSG